MGKPDRALLWSPEAEDDLLAIWQYGASEWSRNLADRHLRTLWLASARLLDNSRMGRSRDELGADLRSVAVDPHVLFYRTSAATIEIVRVLHQREDIDTIFH